jgi:hypothetical protein
MRASREPGAGRLRSGSELQDVDGCKWLLEIAQSREFMSGYNAALNLSYVLMTRVLVPLEVRKCILSSGLL